MKNTKARCYAVLKIFQAEHGGGLFLLQLLRYNY